MINVGIVGGTGYTGVELLRLLAQYPQQARPMAITSSGDAVANMFKTRDQAARNTSQKFGFYECAALSHVPVSL
jgi:N-acetyl-gamma-glutamylphosphate reductase